jgi:hypothetical protein
MHGHELYESNSYYSAVHGFRPLEELAELVCGRADCGEVARGWGCLFAWNFIVTRSVGLNGGAED